ncbi:response regulator transcription factor [Eubacteriaceae bacterium ES3]|nr:response regulator transcription factor [Eubacteriaceae bacterium ES3]
MPKVLVIDDEPNIRRIIRDFLEHEGFSVLEGESGEAGIQEALENRDLDLILLDIRMPGMDGFEVLEALRDFIEVPIVFLTALSDDYHEIKGLNLGADDYISKPFNYNVLMARIKSILRKNSNKDLPVELGPVTIERSSRTVWVSKEICELTMKEYELLNYLFDNRGISLDRLRLLDRIWGYDYDGDPRTIDTHIKTLRAKLGEAGKLIKTVRGVGYRLDENE